MPLSLYLSPSLSLSLSLCLFYPSVSFCLSVSLPLSFSLPPSLSLSLCLSLCLCFSVCLSLSICLHRLSLNQDDGKCTETIKFSIFCIHTAVKGHCHFRNTLLLSKKRAFKILPFQNTVICERKQWPITFQIRFYSERQFSTMAVCYLVLLYIIGSVLNAG